MTTNSSTNVNACALLVRIMRFRRRVNRIHRDSGRAAASRRLLRMTRPSRSPVNGISVRQRQRQRAENDRAKLAPTIRLTGMESPVRMPRKRRDPLQQPPTHLASAVARLPNKSEKSSEIVRRRHARAIRWSWSLPASSAPKQRRKRRFLRNLWKNLHPGCEGLQATLGPAASPVRYQLHAQARFRPAHDEFSR
jgi:hypothetical protein